MNARYIREMPDCDYWLEQIETVKEQITAYNDALIAVSGANGVRSYRLDSGQTEQWVTRYDIDMLNDVIDSLYNRLVVMEARVYGGAVTARGDW